MLTTRPTICLTHMYVITGLIGLSIGLNNQRQDFLDKASVQLDASSIYPPFNKTTKPRVDQLSLVSKNKTLNENSLRFSREDSDGSDEHDSQVSATADNDEIADNFYTHFDQVVENITCGVKIDNSNSKKCVCAEETFRLCNCSNLNLQYIPADLHTNIDGLDMFGNMITSLTGAPFHKYGNLKYLSVQRNQIVMLNNDSFLDLSSLLVLDLRHNKLVMTPGTFPTGVFNGLNRLVALRLNKNNISPYYSELFYPHRALSVLKSLRLLSMDGLRNKAFGSGFEAMTSLETLTLSGFLDGYCVIMTLPQYAFEYLRGLRMLNMSNCFLDGKRLHSELFSPLTNIHTLDVTWNERLSIQNMSTLVWPLRNSNLRKLVIDRVERRFSPGIKVTGEQASKLPRNLTHLVASGNSINQIDSDVLSRLPKSLQYLDVSGNKMVFGTYLKNLSLLENLDTLKADGYQYTFSIPRTYPSPFRQRSGMKRKYSVAESSGIEDIAENKDIAEDKIVAENDDISENDFTSTPHDDIVVSLPPKLRVLSMKNAGLFYYLSKLSINTSNSLERMYLDRNVFPSVRGPFLGLNNLKYLHLSSCSIRYVHGRFFENFPSLEYLDLSQNHIWPSLLDAPFRNLSKLKHLDLYYNGIAKLKNDSFRGLSSMETLLLENNPFFIFEPSISHMGQLRTLNLNRTNIHTLLPKTVEHLDSLKNVKVFMHKAPIKCVCPNLDFLQWMTRSKAIPTYISYTCVFDNPEDMKLSWNGFLNEVNIISRKCISNYALFMPVLGASLLFVASIIGSVAYRFRWRLRYFYYSLNLPIDKRSKVEEGNFKYDVFVSYCSDDLDFVMNKICPELSQRGVKLCLHTRDFHAGEHIITNIIRCVKESRRTLVIITNRLLESKWCRCEFQMAKEEALVTGRKILISLLIEEIPKDKIWLELRANIERNTYIPYPGGDPSNTNEPGDAISFVTERETKIFWDKVVKDITT